MCKKPQWRVEYLVGFGAMTINVEEEFYFAWTKFGAWVAFRRHHGKNLPNSYQVNYSYAIMRGDITRVKEG
jgi:alpha-glucosidase (family GH31 glycosyl hydrolase)